MLTVQQTHDSDRGFFAIKYGPDRRAIATYCELVALNLLRRIGISDIDYTAGPHTSTKGDHFTGPYKTGAGDRFDLPKVPISNACPCGRESRSQIQQVPGMWRSFGKVACS